MEERLLNEKESLELITQMINSSKKNMEVGQGNIMLFWGYFTTALSVVLFLLINFMASDEIHVYHYFSDDRHYGDYIRQTCRFPAYATALPGLLRTRHFHYRHYNTGALDDLRPPHCVYCSNIYANHATDR